MLQIKTEVQKTNNIQTRQVIINVNAIHLPIFSLKIRDNNNTLSSEVPVPS